LGVDADIHIGISSKLYFATAKSENASLK